MNAGVVHASRRMIASVGGSKSGSLAECLTVDIHSVAVKIPSGVYAGAEDGDVDNEACSFSPDP